MVQQHSLYFFFDIPSHSSSAKAIFMSMTFACVPTYSLVSILAKNCLSHSLNSASIEFHVVGAIFILTPLNGTLDIAPLVVGLASEFQYPT
jgi:hypothetical protein